CSCGSSVVMAWTCGAAIPVPSLNGAVTLASSFGALTSSIGGLTTVAQIPTVAVGVSIPVVASGINNNAAASIGNILQTVSGDTLSPSSNSDSLSSSGSTTGPSTALIVGIVFAIIAVIAGGGFLVYRSRLKNNSRKSVWIGREELHPSVDPSLSKQQEAASYQNWTPGDRSVPAYPPTAAPKFPYPSQPPPAMTGHDLAYDVVNSYTRPSPVVKQHPNEYYTSTQDTDPQQEYYAQPPPNFDQQEFYAPIPPNNIPPQPIYYAHPPASYYDQSYQGQGYNQNVYDQPYNQNTYGDPNGKRNY
ncbi:hypothetical protein HK096_006482, partial [Nowakowskiella sp. JEL0078]